MWPLRPTAGTDERANGRTTVTASEMGSRVALRIAAVLFGMFFVLGGAIAFLSIAGIVHGAEAATATSRALIGITGLLFSSAGIGIILYGLGAPRLAAALGLVALLLFVLVFNWIAFGPGERNFRRGVSASLGGVAQGQASGRQAVSEVEGRVVFGAFALAMDALLVGIVVYPRLSRRRL